MILIIVIAGIFTFVGVYNPGGAKAATSSTLNFQGRLLSSSGNIVADGYYNMQFKLYDGGTDGGPGGTGEANAGSLLWTETRDYNGTDDRVRVVNGYFSVNLGSVTAFGNLNWDQEMWITMAVQGTGTCTFGVDCTPADGEMLATGNKRTKLTGVPYAFRAGELMDGSGNAYSADDLIQNQSGADQTAGFRISGTGRANTSFTTPLVDSISGALGIGTSTATGITIGGTTNTTSLTLQGAAGSTYVFGTANNTGGITLGNSTATNSITIGSAAGGSATQTINLGVSSTASSITNINIGSPIGGTTAITGPTTVTNRTSGSSDTFNVSNSTSTGSIAEFKDNSTDVFTIADGGAATFQNSTDGTSAFRVLTSGGSAALNINTSLGSGQLYVINSGLEELGNLLQNPSFEANTGALSTTDYGLNGWLDQTGDGSIVNDAANANTGDRYLSATSDSTEQTYRTKYYNVNPGDDLYAQVYSKTTTGTNGTGWLRMRFYDKDFSGLQNTDSLTTNLGTSYGLKYARGTAPANARFVQLHLKVGAGSTTGAWDWDDVYLKKANEEAPALFKNSVDTTTAFQVQNAAGNSYFTVNTSGATVSVGDAGIASTIQIGNTTGAVAQTIGIGNNATASSTTTLTLGSLIGTSATTIQSGTGGLRLQASGTGTIGVIQIGAGGAGNSTPDFLGLDVKSDTGDPAGGAEGYMYYNTFDNKFRCYQGAAWTDCIGAGGSTTLQQAYDAGGAGDQVIALDDTQDSLIIRNPSSNGTNGTGYVLTIDQLSSGATGGLDIQSAGSGNLFRVRDTTATATDVLTIADGGVTTFRNQADSNAAFKIQNATGVSDIFTVDSSNRNVILGESGWGASDVLRIYTASGTDGISVIPGTGLVGESAYIDFNQGRATVGYSGATGDAVLIGESGKGLRLVVDGTVDALDISTTGQALFKNSSNSATAFQVQNAATHSLFSVDTDLAKINIGGGATTAVLVLDSAAADPTGYAGAMYYDSNLNKMRCYTTAWTDCATGGMVVSETLIPEFPGATFTPDGSNNTGSMTSDFCSNGNTNPPNTNTGVCNVSGDLHNYYSWTADATNDYDLWVNWQVPSDFKSFATSPAINFYGWRTSSSDAVTLTVYDDSNAVCGAATSISGTVSQWNLTNYSTASGCGSISAGDIITFRVQLSVGVTGEFARIGNIEINYVN